MAALSRQNRNLARSNSLIDINESRRDFRARIVFHGGMTARRVLFCTYKILVVVYTAQAAYILYDEKCREHGCIHFAYGEFWEVPGAWLHTFYMMKSASSLYKMTVRGSCTKIVWRFSSISYCCFGVKYRYSVITVPVQRNYGTSTGLRITRNTTTVTP